MKSMTERRQPIPQLACYRFIVDISVLVPKGTDIGQIVANEIRSNLESVWSEAHVDVRELYVSARAHV